MSTAPPAASSRVLKRGAGALTSDRFYLVHGRGHRTQLLLGTQRYLRFLARGGYPKVSRFVFTVRFHDMEGAEGACREYVCSGSEEANFDSGEFFGDDAAREGSILLELSSVEFEEGFDPALPFPAGDFNGVVLVYKPGSYVTGVHLYHGVSPASGGFLLKHAVKQWLKRAFYALTDGSSRPWPREAIGASVVRSSERGRGFAVLHTDHRVSLPSTILEYRSGGVVRRDEMRSAPARATLRVDVPPVQSGREEWGQFLCALPPFGVSRFVTGQRFEDGRICFDHNYFQQPLGAEKTDEVRWFDRALLSDTIIGPSHPWPVFHDERTETLVAMCKQLEPEKPHVYDLRVFDKGGVLVLERKAALSLPPYGMAVCDVSAELRAKDITRFEGTYLITHNKEHGAASLPSRIHAQGVYRFGGEYWNSVQSDASIWASPEPPVPGIEALSLAKVRRKQYWFAPVVDGPDLETLIPVANLSYSLAYDKVVRLGLRYSEGDRVLAEKELLLKPFGAVVVDPRALFGDVMTRRDGVARGCVTIYPRTGITYCASVLLRERKTKTFVLEHVLPLPKLPYEVSS